MINLFDTVNSQYNQPKVKLNYISDKNITLKSNKIVSEYDFLTFLMFSHHLSSILKNNLGSKTRIHKD